MSGQVVEDMGSGKMRIAGDQTNRPLSRSRLKILNEFVDRLSDLADPAGLYPEVCQQLASQPDAAAAIVQIPANDQPLPAAPRVLACHFGREGLATGGELRLSRRVLDSVRNTRQAVQGLSIASQGGGLTLTILDEHSPRTVLCAPITGGNDMTDCLYVDMPANCAGEDALEFVEAMARQICLIRKGLLLAEARAQRRTLDRQLDMARQIQARLVLSRPPAMTGLDIAVSYEPAMWVGGDYCDVWNLADGRLAFAVGDVAGKGLPAAMVMSNLHAALRVAMAYCKEPAEAITRVNRHLYENLEDGMFVTLFAGVMEPATGRLCYVDAGHGQGLFMGADGGLIRVGEPANTIVGAFDEEFTSREHRLPPGGGLLIVTDGITESFSPELEQFGIDGLETAVSTAPSDSAHEIVQHVLQAASRFRGDQPALDDMTVLALLNRRAD